MPQAPKPPEPKPEEQRPAKGPPPSHPGPEEMPDVKVDKGKAAEVRSSGPPGR